MPTKDAKTTPKRIPLMIASNDIVLRQYKLDDANETFALINKSRDHLSQFGDTTAAKYPTLWSFEESIRNPKNPNCLRFGIRNSDEILVGFIKLTPDDIVTKSGEVGYYLGKEFQGRGYMTKGVRLITDYAFNTLKYEQLYGKVALGNTASVYVLERNSYAFSEIQDGWAIYRRLRR